jgi:hypothetical protein
MDDVKINTSKTLTLTLPSDPTSNIVSVSLYHEFGSLVSGPTNATRTSAGIYTITFGQQASGIYILNSAGRHRADFTYTVSGTSYTQSQYINVYTPYLDIDTFFADHPELETDYYDQFDKLEKRIRNIINTFCGQSFEFYPNKFMILQGSGKKTMHLPLPISTLRKVTANIGDEDEEVLHDSTNATLNHIEKAREPHNFQSSYYIQFRKSYLDRTQTIVYESNFDEDNDFKIEGDFGWQFVPNNIEQAADLLMVDAMSDDSEIRRRGVIEVQYDTVRYKMSGSSVESKASFFETTGNIDADVLLMDYTLFVMDYVV